MNSAEINHLSQCAEAEFVAVKGSMRLAGADRWSELAYPSASRASILQEFPAC
jgi:hypothetical protein